MPICYNFEVTTAILGFGKIKDFYNIMQAEVSKWEGVRRYRHIICERIN